MARLHTDSQIARYNRISWRRRQRLACARTLRNRATSVHDSRFLLCVCFLAYCTIQTPDSRTMSCFTVGKRVVGSPDSPVGTASPQGENKNIRFSQAQGGESSKRFCFAHLACIRRKQTMGECAGHATITSSPYRESVIRPIDTHQVQLLGIGSHVQM